MCQLFALNGNAKVAATFSFTGLSARGGRTGDHVDGFGVAFHDDGACRVFIDDGPASESPLADFLRRHPLRASIVLAHIRKATVGPVQLANCHPFVREWQGRPWSFCHNGDLKDYAPPLDGHYLPSGSTDSEHAFCFLLQELRRRFGARGRPDPALLAESIAELAAGIASHGSFNFVLSDGHALYAHGSTRLHVLQRRHPFGTAQLVDDELSLDLDATNGRADRMVLVATEPLTRNEPWTPLAPGELRAYVDGEEVWRSERSRAAMPDEATSPLCVLPRFAI